MAKTNAVIRVFLLVEKINKTLSGRRLGGLEVRFEVKEESELS